MDIQHETLFSDPDNCDWVHFSYDFLSLGIGMIPPLKLWDISG